MTLLIKVAIFHINVFALGATMWFGTDRRMLNSIRVAVQCKPFISGDVIMWAAALERRSWNALTIRDAEILTVCETCLAFWIVDFVVQRLRIHAHDPFHDNVVDAH